MIHPLAAVHPEAELGAGVRVGPFAVIGERVRIGDGVTIGPHAVIEGDVFIGEGCAVYPHAVIGTPPQDLKYRGENSRVEIGPRCMIREFVTINRGCVRDGVTRLGENCLLMANSHVAHDCLLGDRVVLANSVALAGHVEVGDDVWFGGLAGVHQFARIGHHSFVGAGAMVRRDIPPFLIARGDRAVLTGVNATGLERRGFTAERIAALEGVFFALSGLPAHEIAAWLSRAATAAANPQQRGDLLLLAAAWPGSRLGVSAFRRTPQPSGN